MEVVAILMEDQQQIYFGKLRQKEIQQSREFNEQRSSLERQQEELSKSILETQQFKSKLGNCEEKTFTFRSNVLFDISHHIMGIAHWIISFMLHICHNFPYKLIPILMS